MTGIELTALLFISLITVRSLLNLADLIFTLRWLKQKVKLSHKPSTNFIICIPALNEQSTIAATIDSFLAQNYPENLYSIYIATTKKEKVIKGQDSTEKVVRAHLKSLPAAVQKKISIIEYPYEDGHMSHQINHVAHLLSDILLRPRTYFVVYNADSHIHTNTLRLADKTIQDAMRTTNKIPTILQQSAVYQYAGKSRIAEGAGLHQTIWTLTHEIPKLYRQSSRVAKLDSGGVLNRIINSRIAHCVGHGLFVRGDYYLNHPLPQDILNEDLPYGLKACALHESIHPIPSLELASTPGRIANVYRQKSVWFNPFFEFASYTHSLYRNKWYVSRSEVVWLLIQAYWSLGIWLIHSFVLVGGLFVSIFAGPLYVLGWGVAFFLYWILPAVLVTHTRHSIDNAGSNNFMAIFAGIPYVLTHSVGPFIAVYRWTAARVIGKLPTKPKTETQ